MLVDFFSPMEIADRVDEALDYPDRFTSMRQQARQTILQQYDLAQLLPQHLQWLNNTVNVLQAA